MSMDVNGKFFKKKPDLNVRKNIPDKKFSVKNKKIDVNDVNNLFQITTRRRGTTFAYTPQELNFEVPKTSVYDASVVFEEPITSVDEAVPEPEEPVTSVDEAVPEPEETPNLQATANDTVKPKKTPNPPEIIPADVSFLAWDVDLRNAEYNIDKIVKIDDNNYSITYKNNEGNTITFILRGTDAEFYKDIALKNGTKSSDDDETDEVLEEDTNKSRKAVDKEELVITSQTNADGTTTEIAKKDGKLVYVLTLDKDGKAKKRENYENGKLVSVEEFRHGSTGKCYSDVYDTANPRHKIGENEYYDNAGNCIKEADTYDPISKKRVLRIEYNEDGSKYSETQYNNGARILRIRYNDDGSKHCESKYINDKEVSTTYFDKNGKIDRVYNCDNSGKTVSVTYYKYNENGHTEITKDYHDSSIILKTQVFDNNNNPIYGKYTLSELKQKYNFLTESDIRALFSEKSGNTFDFDLEKAKENFYREDIYTEDDYINAFKNDGYSYSMISQYNLSDDEKSFFLYSYGGGCGSKEPARYKLNQAALKAQFPDRDIQTIGELEAALAELKEKTAQSVEQATTIDVNSLFGQNNSITASELFNIFDKFYIQEDPGLQKLKNFIINTCKKQSINNEYDQKDFIKCVFKVLNRNLGIKNTTPVSISKDVIEKLNQKDIFGELEKYFTGEKLEEVMKEYYRGTDGYIDDFCQGGTGDCWLLAAISALSVSEAGRKIISDSIQKVINEKGEEVIRVTFKGIGVSYDITYEEMEEARQSYCYAYGDTDILALELATEKLRREFAAYTLYTDYGVNITSKEKDDGTAGKGIDGGSQEYLLYYLTGNKNDEVHKKEEVKDFLAKIYEDFKNGKLAAYFGVWSNSIVKTQDGTIVEFAGQHAYSILDMTENTVTVANPWYPDKTITLSWDEFASLDILSVGSTSTELSKSIIPAQSYTNKLNYNNKITVNDTEYSINDILNSNVPIYISERDLKYDIFRSYDDIRIFADINPELDDDACATIQAIYLNYIKNINNEVFKYRNWITERSETMEVSPENTEKLGIVIGADGSVQIDLRKAMAFYIELINNATKKE